MIDTASRFAFWFLMAVLALACGCSSSTRLDGPNSAVYALPGDFQATDDNGQKVAIGELIGERVAVIDFWATWCKPCRKSLPEVDELAASVPSDRVAVIALNIGEKPEQIVEFRSELGLRLPIVFDREMALPEKLGIKSLPALIVVAADGQVVHRGKTLDAAARAQLNALLDKREP